MTTIPEHAPVDERGRLLHEDDYPAQLALALARIEATLARSGRAPRDLVELRVRTTDTRAFSAARDVLEERLEAVHAHPVTTVVEVAELPPPGTLVTLGGTVTTTTEESR
jgi:enamine deaminase RidA (YjgF/YER057c/UK114 family)